MRQIKFLLTLFILMLLALPAVAFDSDSDNNNCSGELIPQLDGVTSATTFIGNGTLKKFDWHDYYYFTPAVKGTYTITLDAVVADIKAGISCTEQQAHFRDTSTNTTKINSVEIDANETLILSIFDNGEEFWSSWTDRPYDLSIDFTEENITVPDPQNISISDANGLFEGHDGNKTMTFTVTMDIPNSAEDVTIDYETQSATAQDESGNNDYWQTSGTLTIPSGSTTGTIIVKIDGDLQDEANEEFYLIISNASSGIILDNNASGEILDDDVYDNSNHYYCDTQVFVYSSDPYDNSGNRVFTNPTDVNKVNLETKTDTLEKSSFYGDNINAIGYSVSDNFIWGYDIASFKLTRTDINHNVKTYEIDGMEDYKFHIGDVSMDGVLYMASAYLKWLEGVEKDGILRMYRIDVNPNSHFFLKKLSSIDLSDQSFTSADWAFHPIDGHLYFINRFDYELVKVNPETGAVTKLGALLPYNSKDAGSHVQFFDKDGNFYFYTLEDFYRVDLKDPAAPALTVEKYTNLPLASNGDAARCAYAPMNTKINISDQAMQETNSSTTPMLFNLTLDNLAPAGGIDVTYTTLEGSAKSGSDYIGTTKTVTIPAGINSMDIGVDIVGDTVVELDETFEVNLTKTTLGKIDDGIAVGRIINDDYYHIVFNAVDATATYEWDKNIQTKVASETFNLTILAKYETNSSAAADINITQIDLLTCDGSVIYAPWKSFSGVKTDANGLLQVTGLSLDNIVTPCAKVNIIGNYMTKPFDNYSKDDFAVRPHNYSMTVPTPTPIKADAPFELEIQAVDANGDVIPNYNETHGATYEITYSDLNAPLCPTGNLDLTSADFNIGKIDLTTKYDEMGLLEIKISEIDGADYAAIDHDDTPPLQRLIPEKSLQLAVIPDHFNISWDLINAETTGQTYYSDDSSTHGATLDINITARSANEQLVENYSDICYAKSTQLQIDLDVNGNSSDALLLQAFDINTSTDNSIVHAVDKTVSNTITMNMDAITFKKGLRRAPLRVNFARAINQSMNPVNLSITEVRAFDGSVLGITPQTKSVQYYYARAHVPNQSVIGNVLLANIDYEVFCDGCNKSLFPFANGSESEDSVSWYILADSTGCAIDTPLAAYPNNIVDVSKVSNEVIRIEVENAPHNNVITYVPDSHLLYNRINSGVTGHRFNAAFTSNNAQWAGKGERGMVSDMNVSSRGLMKMDW